MSRATITKTVEIDITIDDGATWFANLDDEQQTQFIVKVAEIMDDFKGGADGQLYHVGGHLRNCQCSTEKAREWVRTLHHYTEKSTHA